MKNKIIKIGVILLIFAFGIFISENVQAQVWQETLESNFDIAETFDELADWSGASVGYIYDQNEMPKKIDGNASMWQYYTVDFGYNSNYAKWISDHGDEFTWQPGSPKSLAIQYNYLYHSEDDQYLGQGPSRMGTFFGDGISGNSGYKNIHVFMMVKFAPGFFATEPDGSYAYIEAVKFLDIISGFTSIDQWGNDEQFAQICTNYAYREYGTANILMNVCGGGLSYPYSLFPNENIYKTSWDEANGCYRYTSAIETTERYVPSASYLQAYENNQWFGIEYRVDLGTLNNSDAQSEIWAYNESGALIGHNLRTGFQKLAYFDMANNKVIIGGNRAGDGFSTENRFYVDDFIIDDERIGPTYFSLLNNQSIPETCSDNIQNQDETGIDCGGVCEACTVPITYGLSNFISAITNWLGIGDSNSDVNSDGVVNTRDLGVMMSSWGE